ncbi:MAG: dihydroneopterin aldolase [Magnetovibrio sp.]|nr:dihydroneopterin aldolase [Magnetovibrio sp.]|tara:strand:- start:3406 stop:3828 length:423 start_codon:yes stop_codon:yes gene_type:complete
MENIQKLTSKITPLRVADARNSIRHVFIRDFVLKCSIGIHAHEKNGPQRVRINLDLAVNEDSRPINDDIDNVICYEKLAAGIRDIVARGHINLVETLADEIAEMSLGNERVKSVRVRIEKLDILKNASSVGIEIERDNQV